MSIRLELTMPVETGGVLLTRPLSVCFASNYESLALKKFHPRCPLSDVAVARDTHIRRLLETSGTQEPLPGQRKTIQYP